MEGYIKENINKSEEELTSDRILRTMDKVARAMHSGISNLEEQKENLQESIEDLRIRMSKGEGQLFSTLTESLVDMVQLELTLKTAMAEYNKATGKEYKSFLAD